MNLTVKEYAAKIGKTPGLVVALCNKNKFTPSAEKRGHQWFIPENAVYEKQKRGRKKK
jgi:hypothetical protein